jgi:hypothetical protein
LIAERQRSGAEVARFEMRNQREEAKGINEATEEFIIESDVARSDGVCGRLKRIVVDPIARSITYLVFAPGSGSSRADRPCDIGRAADPTPVQQI